MNKNDIWEKFQFNDESDKSAWDYLNDQKEGLIRSTGGELKMEIEAVD